MASNSKNFSANLKIGGSMSSSVGKVFSELKSKIKDQESTLKGLRAAYKQAENGTGEYAGKMDELKKHISNAEKELKKLRTTAKFDLGKSLKGVGSKFGEDLGRIGMVAGIAGGAILGVGTAIYATTKSFVDWADDIGDTAEALNISTEALQTWQFAAGTVGVETGKMNATIGKFTATVEKSAEAQAKAKEAGKEYSDSFSKIGINVAHLKKLKLEDQLRVTAEAFKNYQGPISKSALAIKLFGKSGYQLAGILGKGDAELQSFLEKGKKLGYILDENAKKKVDQSASALDTMGMAMVGVRNKIAMVFAPVLERLSTRLTEFVEKNGVNLDEWASGLAKTIEQNVIPALEKFFNNLPGYIQQIKEFGKSFWSGVEAIKEFVGGWKELGAIVAVAAFAPTIISLGSLAVGIVRLTQAVGGLKAAMWLLDAAFIANPVGLVIVAIAGLFLVIENLVDPGGPLDLLGKMFPETMASIRQSASETVNWLSDKIDFLTQKIETFFSYMGKITGLGKFFSGSNTGGGYNPNQYNLPLSPLSGAPRVGSNSPMVSPLALQNYVAKPSTQTNNVTINVQTSATNGAVFGQELKGHMESKSGTSLFDTWNAGMPAH